MVSSTDRFQALHAAWLSLDPGRTVEERISESREAIVASHTSAAALHAMGDLLNHVPELNTNRRKQTVRSMRLHRLPLIPEDVVLVDALPTTTPERTIADLIQSGHDLTHVADAIKDGHISGVLDLAKLREKLDTVAYRTPYGDGSELLENLLDLVGLSTAALATATARSPVGQLIAATAIQQYQEGLFDQLSTSVLSSGMAEAIKQLASSASMANLANPTLTNGMAEAIKQLASSASMANLANPTLTNGMAETIKQLASSASMANLANPTLTNGMAETIKQLGEASRRYTVKDGPRKSLQNTKDAPREEAS
ncbi:hypothetical protein PJL15_03990 [Paenarthrobacter nitroguajacolicus]|nr:hypothetical protein [Paenarthrobacter nitroguajacolicus]